MSEQLFLYDVYMVEMDGLPEGLHVFVIAPDEKAALEMGTQSFQKYVDETPEAHPPGHPLDYHFGEIAVRFCCKMDRPLISRPHDDGWESWEEDR